MRSDGAGPSGSGTDAASWSNGLPPHFCADSTAAGNPVQKEPLPGLKIIWALSVLGCGEKERPLPNGCWCVWRIIAGCWPLQKLKASRRNKFVAYTLRSAERILLLAANWFFLPLLTPLRSLVLTLSNRLPKSDSPRIVCVPSKILHTAMI